MEINNFKKLITYLEDIYPVGHTDDEKQYHLDGIEIPRESYDDFKIAIDECDGNSEATSENSLHKHVVTSSAFDAVDLWNEATKLSTLECNGYWKALRDLERLSVIKIGGLEPD